MAKIILRLTIFGLLVCIGVSLGLWWYLRPAPNHNQLALGEAGVGQTLTIPIEPLQDFDGLSRQKIYELRREAVQDYEDFLAEPYVPADAIFGGIVDGLPWWGTTGQFYYGSGQFSIGGNSEESRFVLNPYLLVGVDLWGWGSYGTSGWIWAEAEVQAHQLLSEESWLYCVPRELQWSPQIRQVLVVYDITTCRKNVNRWRSTPLGDESLWFDLIAYNARDFNLNYIYVDYALSEGVEKMDQPQSAYKIPHYIHRGNSCGYAGGCNNMSPPSPPTDEIHLTHLPAKMVIRLWQNRPDIPSSEADLVYVISFE